MISNSPTCALPAQQDLLRQAFRRIIPFLIAFFIGELPGIVFVLFSRRSPGAMFGYSLVTGLISVIAFAVVRKRRKVAPSVENTKVSTNASQAAWVFLLLIVLSATGILSALYEWRLTGPFEPFLKSFADKKGLASLTSESPYLRGRCLILTTKYLETDSKYLDLELAELQVHPMYYDVPLAIRATTPKEVTTVVMIWKVEALQGWYSEKGNGKIHGGATSEGYDIEIIDRVRGVFFPKFRIMSRNKPPEKLTQPFSTGQDGGALWRSGTPYQAALDFLLNLPRK